MNITRSYQAAVFELADDEGIHTLVVDGVAAPNVTYGDGVIRIHGVCYCQAEPVSLLIRPTESVTDTECQTCGACPAAEVFWA